MVFIDHPKYGGYGEFYDITSAEDFFRDNLGDDFSKTRLECCGDKIVDEQGDVVGREVSDSWTSVGSILLDAEGSPRARLFYDRDTKKIIYRNPNTDEIEEIDGYTHDDSEEATDYVIRSYKNSVWGLQL